MRSRSMSRPASALAFVFAGVLLFAFGFAGSYLIWGVADDEVPPVATSEPTGLLKPERALGTRENPLPIGTEVNIGDWVVTLGQPKDGTKTVLDHWDTPYIPEDGFDFYFIPVTATYQGSDVGTAFHDFAIKFVGEDAHTYSRECGQESFEELDYEVYNGGRYEGQDCLMIPKGAKGQWVASGPEGEEKVFFTAE